MTLVKLTQPVNDFAVARMFGSRSALTFAENMAARARGEDGGVGMQAAIITGALVLIAVGVAVVLAQRADDVSTSLTAPAAVTLPAFNTT